MANQSSWKLSIVEIRELRPDWPEQLVQDYFSRQEDAIAVNNETEENTEGLEDHLADLANPHQVQHDQLLGVTPDQHHDKMHAHDGLDGSGTVAHDDTTGITPDNHHPQLHDLTSHTDVDTALEKEGQGLWWQETTQMWVNRAGYLESWPTGLANGGELNIGPGVNDIEVITGLGVIVDSYTDPLSPPVATGISWDQINEPITAAPAVAGSIVWFSLFNTGVPAPVQISGATPLFVGALRQYATPPGPSLARAEIFLGVAVHNGVTWNEISNPKVLNQTAETLREVATTVLPLSSIISGGGVNELPAFELEQDAGIIWENNRNWHVDKSNPNREALPAASPINFQYVNRDFTDVGLLTTTVDPSQWDDGGVVSGVPGSANTATIQRLYLDPANNYWILWGQFTYANFTVAQANLNAETPVVPFILQNSILLGYIIAEKGKADWDLDEAIFVGAGGGAGGSAGGGVPVTQFIDLSDTPPSYGGQWPLVPIVNEIENALVFEKRTKAVGDYVQGTVYNIGDEVSDGANQSEARINGVTSQPFVSPIGENQYIYQGTMADGAPTVAKLINFGIRTPAGLDPAYIKGYRIWTVAGNKYTAYAILDPNGTPAVTTLLSFTATSDGWQPFNLPNPSIYTGAVDFDVIAQVQEPAPTPVTFDYIYDYQTPQNYTAPANGEMIQGRGQPDVIGVSYFDDGGNDRTVIISGLDVGDTIQAGVLTWSIQAVVQQVGYAEFAVAPATAGTAGVQTITFETNIATPITVGEDLLYWDNEPAPRNLIRGLIGVDTGLAGVAANGNAYGMDVEVQDAFIPDQTEWLIKIVGGISSSGGGGAPPTFAGAGTTGYVPDPITESGRALLDDGSWGAVEGASGKNLIINGDMAIWQRGNSFVGGNGIYTADRWAVPGSGISVNLNTTDVPAGEAFDFSWEQTATDQTPQVYQGIELRALGKAGIWKVGQQVTVSCWVKAPSGNIGISGRFSDEGTSGVDSPGTDFNEIVGVGDGTWQYLTLTAPIVFTPNPNNVCFRVGVYGNAMPMLVTGFKVELGEVATPFIFQSNGDTFLDCWRYYWRGNAIDDFGFKYAATNQFNMIPAQWVHPVPMRRNPDSAIVVQPAYTGCSFTTLVSNQWGGMIRATTTLTGEFRASGGTYESDAEL